MTRKDLNLSLDRGLLEPSANQHRTPHGPDDGVQLASRKQNKRPAGQTRGHAGGGQWTAITIALIAVANMLFLMVAGIWLSGHTFDSAARPGAARAEITPELGLLLAQINNRLSTIDQQLGDLHLALDKQQAIIVPDSFDIDSHLREALSQDENTTDAPPPAATWHINLGNFDSREVALGLQQRMQAIGHQTRIKPTTSDDKTSFLVVLAGFDQRESAELVAKQIMEQTDLNSLWVAEGE